MGGEGEPEEKHGIDLFIFYRTVTVPEYGTVPTVTCLPAGRKGKKNVPALSCSCSAACPPAGLRCGEVREGKVVFAL